MNIVVNGWFWGQLTTGSGQYLHHLAEHLPQTAPEHLFTLVRPVGSLAAPRPAPSPGWRIQEITTPLARTSDNLAKLWFEQVAFPQVCRRLKADVAFVPYWGSPWRRPCRVVVTVHDLIPLLLPDYRGGAGQRLYTRLVSLTAQRAHVVLTDSQASRRDILAHLRVPEQRVHAVLLAADERFQRVTEATELERVRRKYALPEQFILYLGGFDVRKNVPRLVRAYAAATRRSAPVASIPRLVIAGKLPAAHTHFTPDPRRTAAAEGIGDRVHFTGWVDEADKPALYSLAQLFVFPSLYEGFGLPVAEAMACGTPVVTSNRSSLPEVAPGAVVVDPEDEAALATALASAAASATRPPMPLQRTWADVARDTLSALRM